MLYLTLIALSIIPQDFALRDRADIIEVQHLYDEHGRLVFDQLVLWDTNTDPETVVFWRLIKQPSDMPYRDWNGGGYVTTFADSERVRSVYAPSFRERWEQWDVELVNRDVLVKEKRRGLRKGK